MSAMLLFFIAVPLNVLAQEQIIPGIEKSEEYPAERNDALHPCISADEYALVEQECADNCRRLQLANIASGRILSTSLSWPLRAATGLTDCGYYFISAHVDHNPAAGSYKDYNCGTIAYDTHKGTDIAVFPFGLYKMDNSQVEIIAAAAGTIIARSDGNFDRNCSTNSLTANYVIIQHADGSRALYWHMKKNSVTAKIVGQTVAAGEYLGVVGSSGSSSGPHLHFEVWSGSTSATMVDPFAGSCNSINTVSWWTSQKPYTEPAVIKASVHTTDAVFPGCPTTETPNESVTFTIPFQGAGLPAGAAKFYTFFRNETSGTVANLSILNPNGTTFSSWTQTSSTTYLASYRAWTKTLPVTAGTYTFRAIYNGITCSQTFTIATASVATITAGGPTTFCQGDSVILTASAGSSYLWNNGLTTRSITVKSSGSYSVKVTYADASSSTSAVTAVTVNALPSATITASGSAVFCQGDSVVLTASAGSAYLWSNSLTTRSVTIKSAGNYSVKVTAANGCSATSAIKAVSVNLPQNGLAILFRNDTLYTPYGAGDYWYISGNPLPLDSGLSYKCRQTGNYYTKGRDVNNCVATSAVLWVNCQLTGVKANIKEMQFQVSPNPADEEFVISGSAMYNGIHVFKLINSLGQVVLEDREVIARQFFQKTLSMAALPDGLYLLSVESATNTSIVRVLKSRK